MKRLSLSLSFQRTHYVFLKRETGCQNENEKERHLERHNELAFFSFQYNAYDEKFRRSLQRRKQCCACFKTLYNKLSLKVDEKENRDC